MNTLICLIFSSSSHFFVSLLFFLGTILIYLLTFYCNPVLNHTRAETKEKKINNTYIVFIFKIILLT